MLRSGIVPALLLAVACGGAPAPERAAVPPARYVGRASCEPCHQPQSAAWRGSHHDLAMDEAGESTVLGRFDGATFTHYGVTSTFFRKDGAYMVRTDGPDGSLHDYEIAYTFGTDPLQQYLIRFPDGRIQALNVCWDTRPKAQGGQRWFHLYPKEPVPHDDVLHWTGIYQNWNAMCAECHSTNVKKNYDAAKDTFATSWSEIDVACESCHGPGSNHVAWAGAKTGAPDMGLTVRLREPERAVWVMDEATGIAKRKTPRTSRTEIETCGRCHSRRGIVTEDYVPGRPLMDTHRVALLDEGTYYADGQIQDEDYEYGSFLQSRMYAAGVTCSDCHDPHALKPATGNAVCAACHLPSRFDTPSHHHHEVGGPGATCAGCHMPTTNYMVVDARHDHAFKIPRPDLSPVTGAPDACTKCHTGKPASWAAAKAAAWWGTKSREERGWSETIAAGRADPEGSTEALAGLVADRIVPAIVRATAVNLLAHDPQRALPSMLEALADPDPLVRDAAVQALAQAPPALRAQTLGPKTRDAVRTVRIDAGRALAGVSASQLDPRDVKSAASSLEEWRASQEAGADRPEGRLNLCSLEAELGNVAAAEAQCLAAKALAPQIPTVYVNLADVQRARGGEEDARATLRAGLAVAPENAALWHALGLALVRQQRPVEALAALKKAAQLDPRNTRFQEVYRIAESELSPRR